MFGVLARTTRYRLAIWIAVFVSLVVLIVGGILLWVRRDQESNVVADQTTQLVEDTQSVAEVSVTEEESEEPSFDAEALQTMLDEWVTTVGGVSGVTIMTTDGGVLAEHNGDKEYFTASIYKLYVAYAGYLQIDLGLVEADETYLGTRTRAQCLDVMIRESNSPCAETLWAELGKQQLTDQLETYGLMNTSMVTLTTTANDAAIMLAMIARGANLSVASQGALLDSMKNQIYRDTLNKGFDNNITVYNKIGFREQDEYHDTAIIELTDGRQLIVSVLTDGVGTRGIVDLAERIEAVISN